MSNKTPAALSFTEANVEVLHKVFKDFTLNSFVNWTPLWSNKRNKWLKRPTQNIALPQQHLSLEDAANISSSIGLVCSTAHPIIALDIDGVSLKTPSLAKLVKMHPTYMEQSPSGKRDRLRLLYALPSVHDKNEIRRKGTVKPDDQPNDAAADVELFSGSSNFVTLTGQHVKGTPLRITIIEPQTLVDIWPGFAPKSAPVIDIATRMPHTSSASLVPHTAWLEEVPCDRHNPDLVSFLLKCNMTYHDYWLLGLMSIHAAFGVIQGYPIADAWSKLSGDDYDEEELEARWHSIDDPAVIQQVSDRHGEITPATYQWLFNEFSIQWPVLTGKTKVPKPDALENFQAFLRYKEITPTSDTLTGIPFLDGPDYALYPTYYESKTEMHEICIGDIDRLAMTLVLEAQPYKFRPTTSQVSTWLKDLILVNKNKVNRFAREILQRPEYDPETEPDYIDTIATAIIQRNEEFELPSQEFHELLIRKWLLSLGRNMWPDLTNPQSNLPATSEGVLILSSPMSGINKSSFGMRLFPPEWRHLHVTTKPRLSGVFADKDSVQKTIGKLVIDFDEAERIFSHNDTSDLKAYLTERYDLFRPPYGRDMQRHPRFFSCMASTNLTDLVFPREGARRYWWLNVSYVDTYAMDTLDMYNLWRQILHELVQYKGKRAPYILTQSEIKYLESYLIDHTSTNNIEDALYDLYDFSVEGFEMYKKPDRTNLKDQSQSITEIYDSISGSIPNNVTRKALSHALHTLLKRHAPVFHINGTPIHNGMRVLRKQTRFFLPMPRNEAFKRAQEEDQM